MFEEWADYPLFWVSVNFVSGLRFVFYTEMSYMMKGEKGLQYVGNVKKQGWVD